MKPKYRILLISMVFYRDYALLYTLSKILEHFGCECFIVNLFKVEKRIIRAWNPHAVFYLSAQKTDYLKRLFPLARFFLFAAEGGEDYSGCNERLVVEDKKLYDIVDRIFIWGRNTLDHIKKCIELNNIDYIDESHWSDGGKVAITGNIKTDMIRLGKPRTVDNNSKINIGLVGSFSALNLTNGMHPLMYFFKRPDQHDNVVGLLDIIRCYANLMEHLPSDKYHFSLRPYPMEIRSTYDSFVQVKSGILSIDDSIEFSTWIGQQDIVVGTITSTILPLLLSGVRFINVTGMIHNAASIHDYVFTQGFTKTLENLSPSNLDELLEMVQAPATPTLDHGALSWLDYIYNTDDQSPSTIRIAKQIVAVLNSAHHQDTSFIPLTLLELTMQLDVNQLFEKSYSAFSIRASKKRMALELDHVIKSLLSHADLTQNTITS